MANAKRPPRHWLLKTEPDVFSIEDLRRAPQRTTCWDGVRNYQARNFMRDEMRVGDLVLFYHSNAEPSGVAGVAKVVREAYPDSTSWDPADPHFDPKSTPDNPRWQMVDVQLERVFPRLVSLERLREVTSLQEMELLRKGSRLSVQPVRPEEFAAVLQLAEQLATEPDA